MYKCEFADDVALLATTRAAAETAIQAYYSEAEKFGQTVNVSKMKFLVVGHEVQDSKMLLMTVDGGSIECVKEFYYLGSIIAADGQINIEVDKHLPMLPRHFVPCRRLFSPMPTFLLPPRGRYTKLVCSQCCSVEVSVGFCSGNT